MKVLIFEWLTGGGIGQHRTGSEPQEDLQRQGKQMLLAIVADFLRAGVEVAVLVDGSLTDIPPDHPDLEKIPIQPDDDLETCLHEVANRCDRVMLIAPECDGCLIDCLRGLEPIAHKLISPDLAFATIASCKISTFETLRANQFNAFPPGSRLSDWDGQPFGEQRQESHKPDASGLLPIENFPLVLKPTDGAGTENVQLIATGADWHPHRIAAPERHRVEAFIPGTPVSVSVLCGETCEILAPTIQIFDRHPFGNYVRAAYPIDPEISKRAIRLAAATVKSLPPTVGYIGLDLIIRNDPDKPDCLIEVNPRLTMSYLKLREIYQANLATTMLRQHDNHCANLSRSNPPNHPPNCIFREPDL